MRQRDDFPHLSACGRNLETVKRGPFGIECWPTHNAVRITTDYDAMTHDERLRWLEDHPNANTSGEDRCFESGQPV